jgi:hypothetical protein
LNTLPHRCAPLTFRTIYPSQYLKSVVEVTSRLQWLVLDCITIVHCLFAEEGDERQRQTNNQEINPECCAPGFVICDDCGQEGAEIW